MCELLAYAGDDCHVIYKNTRKAADDEAGHRCHMIRQHVEKLWHKFKPYADSHFIDEFRRNPDQRYWEMYLGCCLLDKGFNLTPQKKGPDFNFDVDGKRVWIEAVTATVGQEGSPDRVPDLVLVSEGGGAQEVPRNKIILRYRAALDEKEKKFKSYMKDGMVGKDDIKVIAISSAPIRGWSKGGTHPYILSAVFPIGQPYLSLQPKTGKVVGQGHHFQPAVTKTNGAQVETLFFSDPAHSDISAVIYSNADIGNPASTPGNDFLIIHNPLATTPLPLGLLPYGWEYWAEDEGDRWALKNREIIAAA